MSALAPFDGPCCLIRRVTIPPGHKRCAMCLDVQPLATFGSALSSYCKACRRELYHLRYSPRKVAA